MSVIAKPVTVSTANDKTLAVCLIGSAEEWRLLTSMSFRPHLHFKSKRIVNLNGGNPTDLAIPTTCFAVGFIDSPAGREGFSESSAAHKLSNFGSVLQLYRDL